MAAELPQDDRGMHGVPALTPQRLGGLPENRRREALQKRVGRDLRDLDGVVQQAREQRYEDGPVDDRR